MSSFEKTALLCLFGPSLMLIPIIIAVLLSQ
jgi:hypothetical protein